MVLWGKGIKSRTFVMKVYFFHITKHTSLNQFKERFFGGTIAKTFHKKRWAMHQRYLKTSGSRAWWKRQPWNVDRRPSYSTGRRWPLTFSTGRRQPDWAFLFYWSTSTILTFSTGWCRPSTLSTLSTAILLTFSSRPGSNPSQLVPVSSLIWSLFDSFPFIHTTKK